METPNVYLTDDQLKLLNKIAGYKKPIGINTVAKSKTAKKLLNQLYKKRVIWSIIQKTEFSTRPQCFNWDGISYEPTIGSDLPANTSGVKIVIAPGWIRAFAKSEVVNVTEDYPRPNVISH